MKRQDIEKMYTRKVSELLNQGWVIHTTTMPGSQGEVAHIDLTDGSEIRRVLLERGMSWSYMNDGLYGDMVTLTVGRNTDRLFPCNWDNTIWNNHLEVLFQIEFAEIQRPDPRHPDGWYIEDHGEVLYISQLRNIRREARETQQRRECGDAFKSIALRWLKRTQRGFKSAKLSDVTRVTRVNRTHWSTPTPELECYEIEAKGKTYRLCPPRKR